MAALTVTNFEQNTVPGAGKNTKTLCGVGTIAAADASATLNVAGKISRICNVSTQGINTAEVIRPTTAQPVAGVLTFARSTAGANATFWFEIKGV